MIHDYDTHFWMARLPDGKWITSADYYSYDSRFKTANRIRIEPLSLASIQAVLDAEVPAGYTAFLRTDIHQDVATGNIARIGYIMALEKGQWDEPGKVALDTLPLKDGFRAELRGWDGSVDFVSSKNFDYSIKREKQVDVYEFFLKQETTACL